MSKKCNRCEEIKDEGLFSKASGNKSGYSTMCKACVVQRNKEYWRTPPGRISQIFAVQTVTSRQRKHPAPAYTRAELLTWAYQNGLQTLWEIWRLSDYQKELIPSVDRHDPTKGYSIGNIRLVTWSENNDKAYEDRKSCRHVTKQNRKVNQLDHGGNVIASFDSISDASRKTGITRININDVCRKKVHRLSAGGFGWEYAT